MSGCDSISKLRLQWYLSPIQKFSIMILILGKEANAGVNCERSERSFAKHPEDYGQKRIVLCDSPLYVSWRSSFTTRADHFHLVLRPNIPAKKMSLFSRVLGVADKSVYDSYHLSLCCNWQKGVSYNIIWTKHDTKLEKSILPLSPVYRYPDFKHNGGVVSNFSVRRYHAKGTKQILIKLWLRSKMRRITRQSWAHSQRVSHISNNSEAFTQWLSFYSPQSGQIGVYKDALERLNMSIAFNASDLDLVAAVWLMFRYKINTHSIQLKPVWLNPAQRS